MKGNPILTGKVKEYPTGDKALVADMGRVKYIDDDEAALLKKMTGFKSINEISHETGRNSKVVQMIFEKFHEPGFLTTLEKWNKLRWCAGCRLYINHALAKECPHCKNQLDLVPLSPPCDPWFCFKEEHSFIKEIIENKIGASIPEDILFLGNNCFFDHHFFWEIIVEGKIVLNIHFWGEEEKDWKFDFTNDFDDIDWSLAASSRIDLEIEKQGKANSLYLDELTKNSIALLNEVCGTVADKLPLVYFSGGKESMVMLDLFNKSKIKCRLLFAATGLDFPEDTDFIQEFAKDKETYKNHEFHMAEADEKKSLDLLVSKKRLGIENMWCRSEVKYPIRNSAVKKLYSDEGITAFEGSRWYENDFRRSHPRINFITNIKGYSNSRQTWVHILADWNGFDIWTYIYLNKLKINPLYFKGFQRTTCWMCPLVNPFHLNRSKKIHPVLWEKASGVRLTGFTEKHFRSELPL